MSIKLAVLAEIQRLRTGFKPFVSKAWYYAKVELAPPLPSDLVHVKNDFRRLISKYKDGSWKNTTVKDAWLNTLVATEVACWFFIGECIGKGGLIGYDV